MKGRSFAKFRGLFEVYEKLLKLVLLAKYVFCVHLKLHAIKEESDVDKIFNILISRNMPREGIPAFESVQNKEE